MGSLRSDFLAHSDGNDDDKRKYYVITKSFINNGNDTIIVSSYQLITPITLIMNMIVITIIINLPYVF